MKKYFVVIGFMILALCAGVLAEDIQAAPEEIAPSPVIEEAGEFAEPEAEPQGPATEAEAPIAPDPVPDQNQEIETEPVIELPEATPLPTEAPIPEPVLEVTPEVTEEPAPESAESVPEPAAAPTEAPSAPFEQGDLIGNTIVNVTAPAGVIFPGNLLTIREVKDELFTQAVLAAAQISQGNAIVRHRMFSFSGAALQGAALVKIDEPLLTELAFQYPQGKISVYVFGYQEEGQTLEDMAYQLKAEVNQNTVSFEMTRLTIYDVLMVVTLPEATPAPTEAPAMEMPPEPTLGPALEPTAEPILEPTAEPTPEPTLEPTLAPTETPTAPFEQGDLIGNSIVNVTAPAGVIAPGSLLTIKETSDELFVQAVLAVSQLNKGENSQIIEHSMYSFSGAELYGTARVKIDEAKLAELFARYPGAEITVAVFGFQPQANKLEDMAHRLNSEVNGNTVSFNLPRLTAYDILMVVQLPEETPAQAADQTAEPTGEPAPGETPIQEDDQTAESTGEPTPEPAPEPTLEPVMEPVMEPTLAPTETPAAPFEQEEMIGDTAVHVTAAAGVIEPGQSLTIREAKDELFVQAVLMVSQMNQAGENTLVFHKLISFSGAELNGAALVQVDDPRLSEISAQYPDAEITFSVYGYQPQANKLEDMAHRMNAEVNNGTVSFNLSRLTVYDVMIIAVLPGEENQIAEENEPEAEQPEETEIPSEESTETAAEDNMADTVLQAQQELLVSVSISYEGDLHFGSLVVLTANLSIDDPQAVITWQYSPDGGKTIYTLDGEQGRTYVYTLTEENKDFSWRAVVQIPGAQTEE